MKNLNILIFLALFAVSCDDSNAPGDENSIAAEVDGQSWIAESISTQTNAQGELKSIVAVAADKTRMLFSFDELDLTVPANNLPTDIDGNLLVNKIEVSTIPNMKQIEHSIVLGGIQGNVEQLVLETSPDGNEFETIYSEDLAGQATLNVVFTLENNRSSDNSYLLYRVKLIYNGSETWTSPMASATTSFRGAYDDGPTSNQLTGEFNLSSYGNGVINGNFSFETNNNEIKKGTIVDVAY